MSSMAGCAIHTLRGEGAIISQTFISNNRSIIERYWHNRHNVYYIANIKHGHNLFWIFSYLNSLLWILLPFTEVPKYYHCFLFHFIPPSSLSLSHTHFFHLSLSFYNLVWKIELFSFTFFILKCYIDIKQWTCKVLSVYKLWKFITYILHRRWYTKTSWRQSPREQF